jgi:hypothetical protein
LKGDHDLFRFSLNSGHTMAKAARQFRADFVAEVAFGGLAHFGWAFRQRGLYLPRIAGG